MRYQGGKARTGKRIAEVLRRINNTEGFFRAYVEPFVGACGVMQYTGVMGPPRYGSDLRREVIEMWQAVQQGWTPPEITEEVWRAAKEDPASTPPALLGFLGTGCSYGGVWFSSFVKDSRPGRNPVREAVNGLAYRAQNIMDVVFRHRDYRESIPKSESRCLVYCDPPYQGVGTYKGLEPFDHEVFWQWVRDTTRQGHVVTVSEYSAPDDFECIWSAKVPSDLQGHHTKAGAKRPSKIEKLWRLNVRR